MKFDKKDIFENVRTFEFFKAIETGEYYTRIMCSKPNCVSIRTGEKAFFDKLRIVYRADTHEDAPKPEKFTSKESTVADLSVNDRFRLIETNRQAVYRVVNMSTKAGRGEPKRENTRYVLNEDTGLVMLMSSLAVVELVTGNTVSLDDLREDNKEATVEWLPNEAIETKPETVVSGNAPTLTLENLSDRLDELDDALKESQGMLLNKINRFQEKLARLEDELD